MKKEILPSPLRVVIDTNILVSMLLGSKICFTLYETLLEERFVLVLSSELLREYREVLSRKEFGFSQEEVSEFLENLLTISLIVPGTGENLSNICRDPKDSIILDCAIAGEADAIITGDKDLLVLDPFRKIRIIDPQTFCKVFLT